MADYSAESERLWLRPLSIEDHLDDFHLIMSDARAVSFSTRQPSTDTSATRSLMLRFIPSDEKPWIENYAILLRPSANPAESGRPRMIGTVGATRVLPEDGAIEIAYGLHSDYWGKGYMPEALASFVKLYWAPDRNDTQSKIVAKVDPENVASWRVLEKLGFEKGEVLENAYQRASDVKAGSAPERDHVKWYLKRPPISLPRPSS